MNSRRKLMLKIGVGTLIVLATLATQFPATLQQQASTYYVDAIDGDDANNGLNETDAWQTFANINNGAFSSGDQILLEKGNIWREEMVVPSSGSADDQITIGAYGFGEKPVINGADALDGWLLYCTYAWQVSLAIEPANVFMDNVRLERGAGKDGLVDHEWFWEEGVLYLRDDSGDPDDVGTLIEASQRNYGIYSEQRYIIVDGVEVKYTNDVGIMIFESAQAPNHSIVKNSTINYAGNTCLYSRWAHNVVFEGNQISYCVGYLDMDREGIGLEEADNSVVSNNEVSYTASNGIDVFGSRGVTVSGNDVHDTGNVEPQVSSHMGIIVGHDSDGVLVYQNTVRDGLQSHIAVLDTASNIEIYENELFHAPPDFAEIEVATSVGPTKIHGNFMHDSGNDFIAIFGDGDAEIFDNIFDGGRIAFVTASSGNYQFYDNTVSNVEWGIYADGGAIIEIWDIVFDAATTHFLKVANATLVFPDGSDVVLMQK